MSQVGDRLDRILNPARHALPDGTALFLVATEPARPGVQRWTISIFRPQSEGFQFSCPVPEPAEDYEAMFFHTDPGGEIEHVLTIAPGSFPTQQTVDLSVLTAKDELRDAIEGCVRTYLAEGRSANPYFLFNPDERRCVSE